MKRCGRCKTKKAPSEFWKNQAACKDCQREYRILFRDPQRGRDTAWMAAIAKRGLSVDDYMAMLESQGGVCAICKLPDPQGIRLSVDHDHVTERVRGLLCRNCNVALGLFKDDPVRIEAARGYLAA